MRRLSSSATFFYKRIFPWGWFGFVVLFAVLGPMGIAANAGRLQEALPFLLMPVAMLVVGFLIYKTLLADLVDEVWLDGDALVVKNRQQQVRVALGEVINVDCATMSNPRRIILKLRHDTRFGRRIPFIPNSPRGFLSAFRSDPIADELIERADAARRSQP